MSTSNMEIGEAINQFPETPGWSSDDVLYKKMRNYNKTSESNENRENFESGVQELNGERADTTEEINEKYEQLLNGYNSEDSSFSDFDDTYLTTDEELDENFTNSNIINESVDDRFVDKMENTKNANINKSYGLESNDSTVPEVREISVIEINTTDDEDDEDDTFEDECYSAGTKTKTENIGYSPVQLKENLYSNKTELDLSKAATNHPDKIGDPVVSRRNDSNAYNLSSLNQTISKINVILAKKLHEINCSEHPPKVIIEQTSETVNENKECDSIVDRNKYIENKLESVKNKTLENTESNSTLLQTIISTEKSVDISNDTTNNNSKEDSAEAPATMIDETEPVKCTPDVPQKIIAARGSLNNHEERKSETSACDREREKGGEKSLTDANTVDSEKMPVFSTIQSGQFSVNVTDDDIRNNLIKQLNCLRTRKKRNFPIGNFDLNETKSKKIAAEDNANSNYDKKSTEESIRKPVDAVNTINKRHEAHNELYTQTNELGLVILNVQGGVELDDMENYEPCRKSGELNQNHLTSTSESENNRENEVCDEIRKIIHKKKLTSKAKLNSVDAVESKNDINKLSSNLEIFQKNELDKICRNDSLLLSAETSRSRPPENNDRNQGTEKISPFTSDILDEFLTGDSKLHISYNVPKCDAENGLKDNLPEESPLVLVKSVPIKRNVFKQTSLIKAKTVAQKRKLLEKQRLKELRKMAQCNKKRSTIAEKETTKLSFIMFNNTKLRVKSRVLGKCLANIKFPQVVLDDTLQLTSNIHPQRKLSLLATNKKHNESIEYLPGPMCKKGNLQKSGKENWITAIKTLPRLFLEVFPKIGKPIFPNLAGRLHCDGDLNKERVDFALSMLKSKTAESQDKPKPIAFPLRYHNNQEKIIVRKQKASTISYPAYNNSIIDQKCIRNIVADVIEGLINYVEIKEMAPSLIKEDDSVNLNNAELDKDITRTNENVSVLRKYKKRSKVDLELSRLSCKVVNVEVEEKATGETCNKAFCRLGCICNSLKCENIVRYHCRFIKCMFHCTCPPEKALNYEQQLTLPTGTDVLSSDTVTRIEDEAKKNLAKEEREFTQTVIHTNDKTIIVGLGSRNKARRTTRTPKKYSDYVDDFVSFEEKPLSKAVLSEICLRNVVVSLPRINLSQIIPYCLSHHLYDCPCKGTASYTPNQIPKSFRFGESIENKRSFFNKQRLKVSPKKISNYASKEGQNELISTQLKSPNVNDNSVDKKRKPANNHHLQNDVPEKKSNFDNLCDQSSSLNENIEAERPSQPRSVRPVKKSNLDGDFKYTSHSSGCARLEANWSKFRKTMVYHNAALKNDFIYNITDSDLLRAKLYARTRNREWLEADVLKQQLIAESMGKKFASSEMIYARSKRKQTLEAREEQTIEAREEQTLEAREEQTLEARQEQMLEAREEKTRETPVEETISKQSENKDMAMQRRKKTPLTSKETGILEHVFDGEIIIESNEELLRKIGNTTIAKEYARLLPWNALTESFKNGKIKIWNMIDQPSRLLINKQDKQCPKNYVDIRLTNNPTEVISWILADQLPPHYDQDNMSFILKETKNNFSICGICTKNLEQNVRQCNTTEEKEPDNDQITRLIHKDVNGESHVLLVIKGNFKLQELMEETLGYVGEKSVDKNKLYMWAALPEIYRVCKWRMVRLNSNFSFLSFPKIQFSIRYTDLVNAGQIAKINNCTIMLKNSKLEAAYDHKQFGIYFDPHYQDRLFIGPYFKQFKDNDVETLRYINQTLVGTESFNRMRGKEDYKCGHWLIERPYSCRRMAAFYSTIDLTKDDDDDDNEVAKKKAGPANTGCVHEIIKHNNEEIKVIDAAPRKPEDFNRYIVTNIPHFGYLAAYQHLSGEIDVTWPSENKFLRFSNALVATDFLQQRFSFFLLPIPVTFKISIIILTHIELENTKPIDSAVLRGHFVCGEFGCFDIKSATNKMCIEKTNLEKREILKLYALKAELLLKKSAESLDSLLTAEKLENEVYNIGNILDKALNEIQLQTKLEKHYISLKNELRVEKRTKVMKLFQLIDDLPENQRNIEKLKCRTILNRTEPIEINDSDEERDRPVPENKVIKNNEMKQKQKRPELIPKQPKGKQVFIPQEKIVLKAQNAAPRRFVPILPKLKSVLKPLRSRVPNNQDTSSVATERNKNALKISDKFQKLPTLSKDQYIQGVKLVKTMSGSFVLVSDEQSAIKPGTKLVIKNNMVQFLRKSPELLKQQHQQFDKLMEISNSDASASVANDAAKEHIEKSAVKTAAEGKQFHRVYDIGKSDNTYIDLDKTETNTIWSQETLLIGDRDDDVDDVYNE